MTKIKINEFKKACKGSGGFQSVIARTLKVSRSAICQFLKKNPNLKELIDQEKEYILDIAEHNIDRKIMGGDIQASEWALTHRKKGKARGYGLRQF